MTAPVDRLEYVRAMCSAAGVELPDDDLAAVSAGLAQHEASVVRARTEAGESTRLPVPGFDARWP